MWSMVRERCAALGVSLPNDGLLFLGGDGGGSGVRRARLESGRAATDTAASGGDNDEAVALPPLDGDSYDE